MRYNLIADLIGMLLMLGAVQGFVLAVLLFTKYRPNRANLYLGLLILTYSLFIVNVMLTSIDIIQREYPHWLMILSGLPFLFGPLHMIYVGELTDSHIRFTRMHWYHFLPFILYKLYYLQVFFLSDAELYAVFLQIQRNETPVHILVSGLMIAVVGVFYIIMALIVFKRYSRKIRNVYSSLEKINLYWLRFFTYAALFVWLVVLVQSILTAFRIDVSGYLMVVPLLTSIFVYATGYIGIIKSEIFEQPDLQRNLTQAHEIEERKRLLHDEKKYERSGLTEEKAAASLNDLLQLMERDKPYLNPNITLNDLSSKLNISSHNLSEILNTQLNQNFFDFINRYRIDEVKKYLEDESKDHLTLVSIALDAGFNSKSGFNFVFKKFMDITPSEYRQKTRTRVVP
jgi:AraC-like DNA-binding protein